MSAKRTLLPSATDHYSSNKHSKSAGNNIKAGKCGENMPHPSLLQNYAYEEELF